VCKISVQEREGRDYFLDLVIVEWSSQKCGFGLDMCAKFQFKSVKGETTF